MIGVLRKVRDRMRGVGEYAITVPPMDGTLRPNQDIEKAGVLAEAPAPGHLCVQGDDLWFASGAELWRIGSGGDAEVVRTYPAGITAMAMSPDGAAAVALADGSAELPDGFSLEPAGCNPRCITALAFSGDGALIVACGSDTNPAAEWPRDLLERKATGSVWCLAPDGSATRLASDLAWPAGLLPETSGAVLVSEASRSRVVRLDDGTVTTVLSNLPGYPAGIAPRAGGGYHLSIMAPRNQLIEFILRERDHVRDMIENTPPEYWIAPSMHAPKSFLEPLQGGALKQLGIMKPWAPSRSIGLVIGLDADFVATHSHHSRADGQNHGTTHAVEWQADLIVASRGNNRLLRLPLNEAQP